MPVEDDSIDRPAPGDESGDPASMSAFLARRFVSEVLFLAMLAMALTGVIFRLPVMYWIVLTPIFGLISIAEGWRHFHTRRERVGLAWRVSAIWCALLLCIYLLYGGGVQATMNANASSLAMMTLLALGTFVAGIQARVWQICGIGVVLFLAVPGVGWLNESLLLLSAGAIAIVAIGVGVWRFRHGPSSAEAEPPLTRPSPSLAPFDDASPRST
jgi:hypothetical protein